MSQFEIKLGLNSSGVVAGVDRAVNQFNRLSESAKGLVEAFGLKEVIKSSIENTIAWGAEIQKNANRTQLGVEAFQELSAAAQDTSIDISDVSEAYKKLQIAQVEAIKGGTKQAEAFQRIGISIAALKQLNPRDTFLKVGQEMAKLPISAQTTSDAITLLGKNGDAMLGAFRGGFADAISKAREFGLVLDAGTVKQLDAAETAMKRFGLQAKVTIASMIPPLVKFGSELSDTLQTTILWIQTWASVRGTRQQAFNEANKTVDEFFREKIKKAAEDAKFDSNKPPTKTADDIKLAQNPNPLAKPETDRLLQIGGYRAGGEIATIPAQQLQAQRESNTHLRRIAHYAETGFASKVPEGEVRDLLRKVDNFFQYGFGEFE